MSTDLVSWGGYATFYYLLITGEAEYLATMQMITDDGDGNYLPEAIYYMTINNATGATYGDSPFPYSALVSAVGVPTNDSATDFDPTSSTTMAAGGKLTFNVISDCAVPVDVTIDFNTTFTKCTTDNCAGDGYHVSTTWD